MLYCEGSSEWRTPTGLAKLVLCAAGTGGGQGTDQGSAPLGNDGSDPGAPPAGERLWLRGLTSCSLVHTHPAASRSP